MKNKTAMMELIEMISYTSKDTFYAMEDSGFFKQALEKEKEQIMDAYEYGCHNGNLDGAEQWYNQTYLREQTNDK